MREIHKLAEPFPLLEGKEFDDLCKDIGEHGLQEAIVVLDGKVLDGRNRLRACERIGVEPQFVDFAELELGCTPEEYVWAKNVLRRHLSADQRAALAVSHAQAAKAAAKERQIAALKKGPKKAVKPVVADSPPREKTGKTRTKVARQAKVSEHKIRQAEKLQKTAPEALEEVKLGNLTLTEASKKAEPASESGAGASEMSLTELRKQVRAASRSYVRSAATLAREAMKVKGRKGSGQLLEYFVKNHLSRAE